MKKLFAVSVLVLCTIAVQGQNIENQIIASQYGKWQVPGLTPNTYTFPPTSCRVQGGASFFPAFVVGTPVKIIDSNPALTETVTPTNTVINNVTCAVTIAPLNNHQLPFSLTSATGGLQEALNNNLANPASNMVLLDNQFYVDVGSANVSAVIAAAKGGYSLDLVDITTAPYTWYEWNGTQYVEVPIGGGSGDLGTLQGDLLHNNAANTAAVDADIFVANGPTSGATTITAQQAVTAAQTHTGSAIIQPLAGRTPFTNVGNVRVLDQRTDVPATARGVTEFGATCDTRAISGTFSASSTSFTVTSGTLTAADVGRTLVTAGTVSGVPTSFYSVIASVNSGTAGTVTTAFPFAQSTAASMNLGHDDTAAITQAMTAAGSGGTLVFPMGNCLTHTQILRGQSPIGLGVNTLISGFPGEDIFAAPDPSQTAGVNQGPAHIHDISFQVDARVDATLPWQVINDSGTTAKAAMYRPVAQKSGVSSNPLAPGWFQGPGANFSSAGNAIATTVSGSAVICVPNTEGLPVAGQKVVFPYLSTVFTATVLSSAGSCSTGQTARTLSANLPITATQAEFFYGTTPQTIATAIGSGTCPSTITLANSINPVPGYESNVAPFGLIQIDGEQFSYFGKTTAANPTPANTLYGVSCAQNGTTRASHSIGATVVPLNPFQPAYPWPVTPTVNSGDTTPAGTAGFFPGWNVGNAAFAFPVATGSSSTYAVSAWTNNARIENLSFYTFPGSAGAINHAAAIYWAQPSYGATFANLLSLYQFYGIVGGPPSIENGNWATALPTADTTHYDGIYLYDAVPFVDPYGNQNTFANMAAYSSEASPSGGAALGADTCYYFTSLWNDQTGAIAQALTRDHFKNIYCEPETGVHALQMPQWEWDTFNSEIADQTMGGGGEVYIGGANQHWSGGTFNQSSGTPAINWGTGNTGDFAAGLGTEPKSSVYGSSSLINYGPSAKFSGQTSDPFGTPSGPYGGLQVGNNREPIASQTNETFNTGNTTAPYVSTGGGMITPEEFNTSSAFDSLPMSLGWTYDPTSPVTNAYAACNVGNSSGTAYCNPVKFNQQLIGVGPGQRITNGKYVLYMSAKDASAATNTLTFVVGTTCNGNIGTYSVPLTNAWPTTAAGVFTQTVDFTGVTAAGCGLSLIFQGATTADQVQVGYVDFAPVAEQIYAQTINVTNINGPGGSTGCQQSPVTGIKGGFTCPTKGNQTSLSANQGAGDTTATVSSTTNFSPAGCFFVDAEYECYSSIVDSTHFGGITRGQYLTTAASHNSGVTVVGIIVVLGSPLQSPADIIAYGGSEPPILALNNPTPYNHGGASVFSINNGSNETWVSTSGAITQLNNGAANLFQGTLTVGTPLGLQPSITQTGLLFQTGVQNNAYVPESFGAGHAGSLNVITTPTIGAPILGGALPSGSSTASWVCSGTDIDGNLINGTTSSVTGVASTWSYPQGITVQCPWSAGVNTYQIYRTVGGATQGLIASGVGPGFATSDFGGTATAGTPPASNNSNPHISVAGTGNPKITMGTASITFAATAPSGSCVSGSLWTNSGGSPNTLYVCQSSAWVGK